MARGTDKCIKTGLWFLVFMFDVKRTNNKFMEYVKTFINTDISGIANQLQYYNSII